MPPVATSLVFVSRRLLPPSIAPSSIKSIPKVALMVAIVACAGLVAYILWHTGFWHTGLWPRGMTIGQQEQRETVPQVTETETHAPQQPTQNSDTLHDDVSAVEERLATLEEVVRRLDSASREASHEASPNALHGDTNGHRLEVSHMALALSIIEQLETHVTTHAPSRAYQLLQELLSPYDSYQDAMTLLGETLRDIVGEDLAQESAHTAYRPLEAMVDDIIKARRDITEERLLDTERPSFMTFLKNLVTLEKVNDGEDIPHHGRTRSASVEDMVTFLHHQQWQKARNVIQDIHQGNTMTPPWAMLDTQLERYLRLSRQLDGLRTLLYEEMKAALRTQQHDHRSVHEQSRQEDAVP